MGTQRPSTAWADTGTLCTWLLVLCIFISIGILGFHSVGRGGATGLDHALHSGHITMERYVAEGIVHGWDNGYWCEQRVEACSVRTALDRLFTSPAPTVTENPTTVDEWVAYLGGESPVGRPEPVPPDDVYSARWWVTGGGQDKTIALLVSILFLIALTTVTAIVQDDWRRMHKNQPLVSPYGPFLYGLYLRNRRHGRRGRLDY